MSAIVQMNNKPFVQWKGQTFDQIHSIVRKNDLSNYSLIGDRSKFKAQPLKLYRREIVTQDVKICNPRTSLKVDIMNQPNGTINNSSSLNQNGLANIKEDGVANNSCATYENCSVVTSAEENARRRVRSSGMIKKKYDSSRNSDNYYTTSKQYLDSRGLTFEKNQYNYIRMGDSASKPGSSLASGNLYASHGLTHCKKYFISEASSFQYIWIDNTTVTVDIPIGHYYLSEINDLLKLKMIEKNHFYMKNQFGTSNFAYSNNDAMTFLLNISYNNDTGLIELQTFRTDNIIHSIETYTIPADATWTRPNNSGTKFPQFIIQNNNIQMAFGISNGNYPVSQTANTGVLFQTFNSQTEPGLKPRYKKLYYKPNNSQFATQGAVSSSDLVTRKKYNTITDSAASFRNALGQSVSNALAYGVPANGYTLKDKLGYPIKKTPTFSKYNEEMLKCDVRTLKNAI